MHAQNSEAIRVSLAEPWHSLLLHVHSCVSALIGLSWYCRCRAASGAVANNMEESDIGVGGNACCD